MNQLALTLHLLLYVGGALAQSYDSAIKWGPCDDSVNGTAPLECAKLAVPLDYTAPNSSDKYALQLIRNRAAANVTSKGTVIFNFGGPGASSFATFSTRVADYRKLIGPDYDLLTFNPRGTANDALLFDCYPDETERSQAFMPDPLSITLFDSSDAGPGTVWAESKVRADKCFKTLADVGELIGTAFVVRDMLQIADALGEDLLNYYGVSYGTVLGATLAAMFPNKIGRMVLDSVVNPHDYMYDMDGLSMVLKDDAVVSSLLSDCVDAGPSRCPLAQNAATAAELEAKIFNVIDGLRTKPIALPTDLVRFDTVFFSGTLLDYSSVKTLIFLSLYYRETQLAMVSGLDGLLTGNYAAFATWRDKLDGLFASATRGDAYIGIACGDKVPRSSNYDDVRPGLERALNVSRIAGGTGPSFGIPSPICAQWRMAAKERYQGDFHAETKNPVLLLANRLDPATPIESARNVSAGLEGSRVLEMKNGIGHGVHSLPSKCVTKALNKYFGSGALPEDTTCEVDDPLF